MKKLIKDKLKQLIIKESVLKENHNVQERIIKKIVLDLDRHYEKSIATIKKGGEYFDKSVVTSKIDNNVITLPNLLLYFMRKYENLGYDFLRQVITDWYQGNLSDNYNLTKNVSTF